MKRVNIADIIERQGENKYSLLLLEDEGHRGFIINIGLNEAWAIIMGLRKIESVRPKTHQLMLNIIKTANLKLKEVIITETKDKIFYSRMMFYNDTKQFEMDARPSDGVTLAVYMDTPIYVNAQVLDEFSFPVPEKFWGVKPNQKGILAIIEKMIKRNLEAEIYRKAKTKSYIAETTKEIMNKVFSD